MRALLTAAEVGQLARPCYADETILTALIAEAEREDIKARIGDGLYLSLKEAETDADLTEDQRLLLAGGTWTDTDGGSHLLTGLRTALAYYVYARVVRDGNIQSTRFGARLKTDENSTGTEDAERQRQYRQAFASADKYIAECVAFINRNAMTGGCARKVRSNRTKFHVVGGQAPAVSRVREDCGGSYVPQDTYTKEETDALLAGKADVSALEPIEQAVSSHGSAISDLGENVSQLSGRTGELESKLNYVEPYDSGLRLVDGKSEEMMDINVQEHSVNMSDDSSTVTIVMNGNTGTVSANEVEVDIISLGSKDLSEILAGKRDKVGIASTQPVGGFLPNVLYTLGLLTGAVTFALAAGTAADEYMIQFSTGDTAPTITWFAGVSWLGGSAPTINANKTYQVSVVNNLAVIGEF